MIIQTFGKALLALMLVMLAMAIILGTSLAKADYLSPLTNAAQARQVDASTEYQRGLNRLELQLRQAQTQSDIERIQTDIAEYKHQKQLNDWRLEQTARLDVAFHENLQKVFLLFLAAFALAAIVIFMFTMLRWINHKIPVRSEVRTTESYQPTLPSVWDIPEYRSVQIKNARKKEKEERESMFRLENIKSGGNGHKKENQNYRDLPLV